MPLLHKAITLPSGKPAFQVTLTRPVTGDDARVLRALTNQGGVYCGLPELAVLEPDVVLPPEFREAATKRDDESRKIPVAVVMPKAPAALRVATKFVVKVEGVTNSAFEDEASAIRWLDSVA